MYCSHSLFKSKTKPLKKQQWVCYNLFLISHHQTLSRLTVDILSNIGTPLLHSACGSSTKLHLATPTINVISLWFLHVINISLTCVNASRVFAFTLQCVWMKLLPQSQSLIFVDWSPNPDPGGSETTQETPCDQNPENIIGRQLSEQGRFAYAALCGVSLGQLFTGPENR